MTGNPDCGPARLLLCSAACCVRGCAWDPRALIWAQEQALYDLERLCSEVIEELESTLNLDYGPDQARELGREFRQELRTILRQQPSPPEPDPLSSRPVTTWRPPSIGLWQINDHVTLPEREGGPAI